MKKLKKECGGEDPLEYNSDGYYCEESWYAIEVEKSVDGIELNCADY